MDRCVFKGRVGALCVLDQVRPSHQARAPSSVSHLPVSQGMSPGRRCIARHTLPRQRSSCASAGKHVRLTPLLSLRPACPCCSYQRALLCGSSTWSRGQARTCTCLPVGGRTPSCWLCTSHHPVRIALLILIHFLQMMNALAVQRSSSPGGSVPCATGSWLPNHSHLPHPTHPPPPSLLLSLRTTLSSSGRQRFADPCSYLLGSICAAEGIY